AMLGRPLSTITEEPEGPVLWPRGGGGGPDGWRMNAWLWPLPGSGDLTLVAAWPARDVEESAVTVHADELRDAAREAEKLWDVPPDATSFSGGWSASGGGVTMR